MTRNFSDISDFVGVTFDGKLPFDLILLSRLGDGYLQSIIVWRCPRYTTQVINAFADVSDVSMLPTKLCVKYVGISACKNLIYT
ncbi:MAG: hypothetical protein LBQ66_13525 [Planctomycetaceae bacterium]|nr:hypothetical protein [Planctomycetaceae bacterium]